MTKAFHPLVWNSNEEMKRVFQNYDRMQLIKKHNIQVLTGDYVKKVIKDVYEREEISPELYQKCLDRWCENET